MVSSGELLQEPRRVISLKTPFFITQCLRFEVFMAVTMKNGVFWDVTTRATRRNIPEDTILHYSVSGGDYEEWCLLGCYYKSHTA
jgi:hypothetical protein